MANKQAVRFHFLQALGEHFLAGATEHSVKIVETHRLIAKVPQYRPLPLATDQPHASFDRARIIASLANEFALSVV